MTDLTLSPEQFVALLASMQRHGSSLELNWGEDTGQWECSWTTGGNRHTGVSRSIDEAVLRAYYKARGRTWLDLGPDARYSFPVS